MLTNYTSKPFRWLNLYVNENRVKFRKLVFNFLESTQIDAVRDFALYLFVLIQLFSSIIVRNVYSFA